MTTFFTSQYWINHFKANALEERVDWTLAPSITGTQKEAIKASLQAWQLGETSEGLHLVSAATKYANKIGDLAYIDAVKLFIKEEQKHGNNLGRYLDAIDVPRVKSNWGDSLFRKVRYCNTSMEIWTLAVIVVESTAQIFYQALKEATRCKLLKQICTDILIDEAYHITFQTERLAIILSGKTEFSRRWRSLIYLCFFIATSGLVWFAHHKLFQAGGISFASYYRKMGLKYRKTLKLVTRPTVLTWA